MFIKIAMSTTTWILLTLFAGSLQAQSLVSAYPGATVFEESQKTYTSYQVIESEIAYVIETGTFSEEGYLPKLTSRVEGEVSQRVYDHRKEDSAVEIFKEIRAELDRKGFKTIFSCEKEACGDVAGWRLYFSRYVDGDILGQHYLLAQNPNLKNGNWFLAFYVNEFSGRPRSIVHTVNTGDVVFRSYHIRTDLLGPWLLKSEGPSYDDVLFAFDSAELSSAVEQYLTDITEKLRKDNSIRLSIEGHADKMGSNQYNQALSERRAFAVMEYLVSQGIDASRISARGYGETRPVSLESDDLNRRVAVVHKDVENDQ